MKGEARGLVANRGAITISIMLAPIMQGVDTTIANVALPHMQGSLSAAQDQIAWVLTSYIVAAAIMTPLTGWLAGRFGIKYVFLISVAGFTLASALCGSATSLAQLVIYRVLQGVCGAALVPLSQSVLLQINPPERHARAMAVWGTGTILGPVIGPALGGWLTDDYNWRWVFYINLPVGALATLGILIFIRETRHAHREPFDFFGFATLSLAIGALQLMLDRGELKDWFSSTEIWISATIAGLCFYLFVVHTVTATDRSFLNRDLLKDGNFVAGTVLMFFIGIILNGTLALVPTMLQEFDELPGTHDRAGDGTARHRHDDRDVSGGAPDRPCRHEADHPNRAWPDRGLAVADDRVFAADGDGTGHLDRRTAGLWARLCLHPAEHGDILDLAAADPDPGYGDLQPDAQYRRQLSASRSSRRCWRRIPRSSIRGSSSICGRTTRWPRRPT